MDWKCNDIHRIVAYVVYGEYTIYDCSVKDVR